jgi:hypothetical protein
VRHRGDTAGWRRRPAAECTGGDGGPQARARPGRRRASTPRTSGTWPPQCSAVRSPPLLPIAAWPGRIAPLAVPVLSQAPVLHPTRFTPVQGVRRAAHHACGSAWSRLHMLHITRALHVRPFPAEHWRPSATCSATATTPSPTWRAAYPTPTASPPTPLMIKRLLVAMDSTGSESLIHDEWVVSWFKPAQNERADSIIREVNFIQTGKIYI